LCPTRPPRHCTCPAAWTFGWRVEQLAREGSFAVILGDPGTGKSVALRLLAARLDALRDVVVGVLTRAAPISIASSGISST
jgi:KaiC/GvpD/RAD55 family RecA-like ATPase